MIDIKPPCAVILVDDSLTVVNAPPHKEGCSEIPAQGRDQHCDRCEYECLVHELLCLQEIQLPVRRHRHPGGTR